jgi:hypothetical protein
MPEHISGTPYLFDHLHSEALVEVGASLLVEFHGDLSRWAVMQ